MADSNPTRARRKAVRDAGHKAALSALAAAQRRVEAAESRLETAERDRDDALLAAKAAGVRSPALSALLGASRWTVLRRAQAAQEAAA